MLCIIYVSTEILIEFRYNDNNNPLSEVKLRQSTKWTLARLGIVFESRLASDPDNVDCLESSGMFGFALIVVVSGRGTYARYWRKNDCLRLAPDVFVYCFGSALCRVLFHNRVITSRADERLTHSESRSACIGEFSFPRTLEIFIRALVGIVC